ncbi:MAG: hypothetical protein Q8O75_02445 [bacterium]|nr:hypothetical protein [bacterium]
MEKLGISKNLTEGIVFWVASFWIAVILVVFYGWKYEWFDLVSWMGLKQSIANLVPAILGSVYVGCILVQHFYCLFLKKGGSLNEVVLG